MDKFIYSKNKILDILATFYELTGVSISFFANDMTPTCILDYAEEPAYCEFFLNNPKTYPLCQECNFQHAEECIRDKQTHIYTCHAGLIDTITPIYNSNQLMGFIMFGKLRDDEQEYTNTDVLKSVCDNYNIDYDKQLTYYNKTKHFPISQIFTYIKLLRLCIDNIFYQNLITQTDLYTTSVLDYINKNFNIIETVQDLENHFYITHKTLYNIVKKATGKNIVQYVTELRIDAAKKLLVSTDKSISAISAEVGYMDYNRLIKNFKALTGKTPLQYKKQHR